MNNPTILHLLAYLYIAFAKTSNNKLPIEEEITIKKKIAKWMDLSYKNVGEFEMVMRQSLEWFNETPEEDRTAIMLHVANEITKNELMDQDALEQVLSEIRDISISDGYFEKGEKLLHDKIAEVFGFNIITTDEPNSIKAVGFKYNQKPKVKKPKGK